MGRIRIERNPSAETLEALGVFRWPVWIHEEAEFPWTYGEEETCYVVEGEATILPDDGPAVRIAAGDLVVFPADLSCRWRIHAAVRTHYAVE